MRAAVFGVCLVVAVSAFAQQPAASAASSGKTVLEAYASAWNRHDFAALDKILAPDGVSEDIALAVYAQGAAQVKDFMQKVLQAQPDLDWRLTRVVESGPVGRRSGHGPARLLGTVRLVL